eukprot:Nitzschia sp. Nitz4//scaffold308_size21609//17423//18436//NITZ4_008606-RA/size21609-processed-gene-0.35-mRNA-1//1//CDS//3329547164//4840//frame0
MKRRKNASGRKNRSSGHNLEKSEGSEMQDPLIHPKRTLAWKTMILGIPLGLAAVGLTWFWCLYEPKTSNTSKWDDFDGIAKVTDKYRLIQRYHHDQSAFTQGLFWHSGNQYLVESTGMYGESVVRFYSPTEDTASADSNTVLREHSMRDDYFGEGLCWFLDKDGKEKYIQLTWRERTAFVYNADDLSVELTFQYSTTASTNHEGWGITFDPESRQFYVTDGSDTILIWNLQFREVGQFRVSATLAGRPMQYIKYLNELEWDPADGTLLANVYFQNAVIRIHPVTGQVLQVYDLKTLYKNRLDPRIEDVMNGIAHHRDNQWWVTGKLWPYLYLVEFLE